MKQHVSTLAPQRRRVSGPAISLGTARTHLTYGHSPALHQASTSDLADPCGALRWSRGYLVGKLIRAAAGTARMKRN
jgi:hypothetical protein